MHSVRVSSQLLVSVLFIAVPNNTEILKFFLTLVKICKELVHYLDILICFIVHKKVNNLH